MAVYSQKPDLYAVVDITIIFALTTRKQMHLFCPNDY